MWVFADESLTKGKRSECEVCEKQACHKKLHKYFGNFWNVVVDMYEDVIVCKWRLVSL